MLKNFELSQCPASDIAELTCHASLLCAALNLGNISCIFVLMPTVMDSLTNKKSDADQLTYFGMWFTRSSCIEQFQRLEVYSDSLGIWHSQ